MACSSPMLKEKLEATFAILGFLGVPGVLVALASTFFSGFWRSVLTVFLMLLVLALHVGNAFLVLKTNQKVSVLALCTFTSLFYFCFVEYTFVYWKCFDTKVISEDLFGFLGILVSFVCSFVALLLSCLLFPGQAFEISAKIALLFMLPLKVFLLLGVEYEIRIMNLAAICFAVSGFCFLCSSNLKLKKIGLGSLVLCLIATLWNTIDGVYGDEIVIKIYYLANMFWDKGLEPGPLDNFEAIISWLDLAVTFIFCLYAAIPTCLECRSTGTTRSKVSASHSRASVKSTEIDSSPSIPERSSSRRTVSEMEEMWQ